MDRLKTIKGLQREISKFKETDVQIEYLAMEGKCPEHYGITVTRNSERCLCNCIECWEEAFKITNIGG